jgi:hypothetical protein
MFENGIPLLYSVKKEGVCKMTHSILDGLEHTVPLYGNGSISGNDGNPSMQYTQVYQELHTSLIKLLL